MDDLQKYVDDHANQLAQFKKDMQAQMENSKKLFHLMRRMEFQMVRNSSLKSNSCQYWHY